MSSKKVYTDSGIEIKELYTKKDIPVSEFNNEMPGEFP